MNQNKTASVPAIEEQEPTQNGDEEFGRTQSRKVDPVPTRQNNSNKNSTKWN